MAIDENRQCMAQTDEITDILIDLTFPTTREYIIEHARQEGATEDVIEDLQTLPDDEFVDELDVWKHLGLVQE